MNIKIMIQQVFVEFLKSVVWVFAVLYTLNAKIFQNFDRISHGKSIPSLSIVLE
jgi:hypothetical protein